jgi:hypothetical protein
MTILNLGKIRVGDLGKVIDIIFQDTTYQDVNIALDLTGNTGIFITFIDPDGVVSGPYSMTVVNSPGTDGLARWIQSTDFWTKPGFWHWYGTVTFTGKKSQTNDAIREILE